MPFHDPGNQYIQSSSSGLNPTHILTEEIKKINIKLAELQVAHEQLALHVENNEMVVGSLREEVHTTTSKSQSKSASAAKNISNQHPKLKYVAFLHILDTIYKQQQVADPQVSSSGPAQPDSTASMSGPAPKRQKTTKKKDNLTKSFDVHPSQMEDQPLHSAKAKPTIPFKTMIRETWLLAHPGQQVVDAMEWLEGFYLQAREGELSRNDQAYLDELAEFLASNLDN
ncbi:hypothetical protein EDC04DRAFT_2901679 [Pisolithus marmoratus]|nr:hypothetical protein EDC04DRAFT_2901679 [Pisolithus marmoratus]